MRSARVRRLAMIVTVTCAVTGAASVPASAANVTAVGSQLGVGNPAANGTNGSAAGWRTPTVTKTLDIDGDNIYGSLGYVLFNPHAFGNGGSGQGANALTNATVSLPAYIAVDATGSNISYSGNYTTIDNPANPAGAPIWSGIAYTSYTINPGIEASMFSITFGTGTSATATYRVGVFVDNGAPISVSPVGLRIAGAGGDSGIIAKPTAAQVNNYYFFDLDSVAAGDVFTVLLRRDTGSGGTVALGGLTFDALIPEPASAMLVLSALGALALRRQRR